MNMRIVGDDVPQTTSGNYGWGPEEQEKYNRMYHDLIKGQDIKWFVPQIQTGIQGIAQQPAQQVTEKPTNPKDAIGSGKFPLHLWPATATALGSLAMLDGALKYGRSNFRAIGVRASIYIDAANRHLSAWFEGEDNDPDSGLPHLAHALACIAILVDAQAAGKLNDDRMVDGNYRDFLTGLFPHVARLKKLHEGKNPKHYTIEDKV